MEWLPRGHRPPAEADTRSAYSFTFFLMRLLLLLGGNRGLSL
jgi:hypothetical protein